MAISAVSEVFKLIVYVYIYEYSYKAEYALKT